MTGVADVGWLMGCGVENASDVDLSVVIVRLAFERVAGMLGTL